ncbi:MAG: GIY-YIG nuclease family protein [Anaerolineae bacterium]|nr:GIY-YIG nuclease family protein [Anaerolineae bacterium]
MSDSPVAALPAVPGTYALLIHVNAPLTIRPGRLGTVALGRGWYVYTGSAHGPGGLRARVSRHLRRDKTRHWHIDALTCAAPVAGVWAVAAPERLECVWAAALRALPGVQLPAAGFGASDCTCPAHLLQVPDLAAVAAALNATLAAGHLLYLPVMRGTG